MSDAEIDRELGTTQPEPIDSKDKALTGSAEPLLRHKSRQSVVDGPIPFDNALGMLRTRILDTGASTSSSDVDLCSPSVDSVANLRKSGNSILSSSVFAACARPEAGALAGAAFHSTYGWVKGSQLPIVYHDRYNISFWGLEKLSQYDAYKFQKVMRALVDKGYCTAEMLLTPVEATNAMMSCVHSEDYLTKLTNNNWKVMQVCEINSLLMVPPVFLQWHLVYPLRLMAAGTVLAAGVALQRGWAINLGGGMHHARYDDGVGWCAFNDITLAIHKLREVTNGAVQRVLYIDLDAHQGNGVALNKQRSNDEDLYILDMYNSWIFPHDAAAKDSINLAVELSPQTKDEEYLDKLQQALAQAVSEFQPDLIMYNAGADVLSGDSTGRLSVSPEGLISRDELVFGFALAQRVPVCMTLAGGYASMSAQCVADSIANLMDKFGLRL